MIYDIYEKRKYVRTFDPDYKISKGLINSLLMQAWKVTPSKNNFMPYKLHVLGPEHQEYKKAIYINCAGNEAKTDGIDDPLSERYKEILPNYANILSCSYLMLFTMRFEDQPSVHQKKLMDRGHTFEPAMKEKYLKNYSTVSLEVGLFADAFSALCLEQDIDVSYTLCFRKELDTWKDLPFVDEKPVFIMVVGKAKDYLIDKRKREGWDKNDPRPDFDRIVHFVD